MSKDRCYVIAGNSASTIEVFAVGDEKKVLDRVVELIGELSDDSRKLAGQFIDGKLENLTKGGDSYMFEANTFRDNKLNTVRIYGAANKIG